MWNYTNIQKQKMEYPKEKINKPEGFLNYLNKGQEWCTAYKFP